MNKNPHFPKERSILQGKVLKPQENNVSQRMQNSEKGKGISLNILYFSNKAQT